MLTIERLCRKIRDAYYDITIGISNLVKWCPVIWKDRQFDFCFSYDIMKKKLELMEPEFRRNLYIKEANDIHMCKILCERLIEDNYSEYFHDKFDREDGLQSFKEFLKATDKKYIKAAEYNEYMRKQDMELLFKTIIKKGDRWWI